MWKKTRRFQILLKACYGFWSDVFKDHIWPQCLAAHMLLPWSKSMYILGKTRLQGVSQHVDETVFWCSVIQYQKNLNLYSRLVLYPLRTKKKKNVKRISLSVEAATFRLKLGPLASSSRLWSFHTVEMSPVTRTYRLPVQCASALCDPLGLCFSFRHAPVTGISGGGEMETWHVLIPPHKPASFVYKP